jgi:LysM repeat protein
MSKGWDSKSVAEQQAQTESESAKKKTLDHEQHKAEAELKRKRRELELQRERILAERTSNPHRRTALAAALEEVEVRLGELGWTVHLD